MIKLISHKILGVAFIGVLCFLLWLTYAFYAKVFTETVNNSGYGGGTTSFSNPAFWFVFGLRSESVV